MNITYGVVSGRFQPFHVGHMEYILEGFKLCDHLLIGLTNPDPLSTTQNKANLERSMPTANPFTYWERKLMIERSLLELEISLKDFSILPIPICYPHLIKYYLPINALILITKYDDWGNHKHYLFRELGYKVIVMWTREPSEKVTSGTCIRQKIRANARWKNLVPNAVYQTIIELKLEAKVKGNYSLKK